MGGVGRRDDTRAQIFVAYETVASIWVAINVSHALSFTIFIMNISEFRPWGRICTAVKE